MAGSKNSFMKNAPEKKPVKKMSFWERLFKGEDAAGSFRKERAYPKNADDRMTMLAEEIGDLANTLTINKKSFKPKEYEVLGVLQRALWQRAENQPSFEKCDFMEIDRRLFDLCRSADDAIRRGYYTAALWSMRGLSSGLIDVRQEAAQAELSGYGDSGDALKKVLADREKHLVKYLEIAYQYFMIDRSSQALAKRKEGLEKKNEKYKQTYQEFDALRTSPEGMAALKLLMMDPAAAVGGKTAGELDELIRTLSREWVACEVESELILDLRNAIEALENGVSVMRSALNSSSRLQEFIAESRVSMEKMQTEARENRMRLYENVEEYQKLINEDRQWQKSFQKSELFKAVAGNSMKQLNLREEEKEEAQRLQDAITREVQEERMIIADERKRKAEESVRIEEEVRKAEEEADKVEAEAEAKKAEAEAKKAEFAARLRAQ